MLSHKNFQEALEKKTKYFTLSHTEKMKSKLFDTLSYSVFFPDHKWSKMKCAPEVRHNFWGAPQNTLKYCILIIFKGVLQHPPFTGS